MVNNKGAELPLYLSYVCENLRQFGDYSLVTKRLQSYPPNIDDLQNILIDEAFTIIDNQPLVDAVSRVEKERQKRSHSFNLVPQIVDYLEYWSVRNGYCEYAFEIYE